MNGTTIRRKIVEFIVEHQARWRDLPGVYELRQQFAGLTEDVDLHLEQLAREGLLHLKSDGTIELRPTLWQGSAVEIHNSLPASSADRSSGSGTANGSIFFDLRNLGIETEADLDGFVVLDNSMEDAGIRSGDIAILTHRGGGDIVAVRMDCVLTLRRLVNIHGIPHYLAENALRPDLWPAYEVPAYGTLWGIVRAGLAGGETSCGISYSDDQRTSLYTPQPRAGGFRWPPAQDNSPEDRMSTPPRSRQQLKPSAKASKKTASPPKAKLNVQLPSPPPKIGLNERSTSYRTP